MRLNIFILFLMFGLNACTPSHDYRDGSSTGGYIYNEDIDYQLLENAQNIITGKCLGCHGPGSTMGYLNFPELINDGFITAGPPEASILYRCINNSVCITRSGLTTDNMAMRGDLDASEILILNEFIDELFYRP